MTNDQIALLTKARKSLDAAIALIDKGFYDFAIARVYYTMFYLAQSLLLDKGLSFSKHGSLLGAFGLHFIKSGAIEQKFHRYLIDSFDLRHTADYDNTDSLSEDQAKEQIVYAEEFLAMTKQFLTN